MLHAKFQGHMASGSREGHLKMFFFFIYGHGGHLGHVTKTISINSCAIFQRRLP